MGHSTLKLWSPVLSTTDETLNGWFPNPQLPQAPSVTVVQLPGAYMVSPPNVTFCHDAGTDTGVTTVGFDVDASRTPITSPTTSTTTMQSHAHATRRELRRSVG